MAIVTTFESKPALEWGVEKEGGDFTKQSGKAPIKSNPTPLTPLTGEA
jgi:hypothetical protein